MRPGIGTAFVARSDGRLVDIVPPTPSIIGKDFSLRDWYRGVTRSGAPYVSEAYQTQASNQANVVGVAAPVLEPDEGGPNRRLAILVLAYQLDTIQSSCRTSPIGSSSASPSPTSAGRCSLRPAYSRAQRWRRLHATP